MRTERVRQENNTGFFSALKAGAAGAAAGAVARRVFPATASEVDSFTSSGTKNLAEAAKAAKKERPLLYFAAVGAIVAMTGHVVAQAVKSVMPEKKPQKEPEKITMADAILEGLGTNTEIFILTSEAIESDNKKSGENTASTGYNVIV